jgi:CRP/FNR family transcriptional regulator, anaerobic regulatory protein
MPAEIRTAEGLRQAVVDGNGLLEKLLDTLPPKVTERLLSHASVRVVAPGEAILESSTDSKIVGYVLHGTLAMVQTLKDGKLHIVGLLVPTDIFGRLFDGPSSYRIQALSSTEVLTFPRAFFEEVLRDNPQAEQLFLVHLLDEADAAREWLLLISGRKALNRLASFLSILLRRSRFKANEAAIVHVPLSRRDLAHYLGSRPETLSRGFHELERQGILRIVDSHHFEVLDEEALIEVSGEDLLLAAD